MHWKNSNDLDLLYNGRRYVFIKKTLLNIDYSDIV